MAKVIEPCASDRGHFWRPVNDNVSQCARCGECATAADFEAARAIETAIEAKRNAATEGSAHD